MAEYREKLIAAKQRRAEKERASGFKPMESATADRLPPGQHLTRGFPVLDLGVQPEIALEDWSLSLTGLVEHPVQLDWKDLQKMSQVEETSDFHCVTTWSKFDCRWRGVRFTEIIELVRPTDEARFVYFTAYDDYTTNLPLECLVDDDVLVATQFEGKPITREHGGPARMIVPKLYGWKGAKFVREIDFTAEDRLGFWEVRGYSNTADPFTEDRYA